MRKGRDPPSKLAWQTVVLIELEWGFALFDVDNEIFDIQSYVYTLICRPCRSVNSILPLMVLCFVTAEHDLGAFYQPTSCSSGSYF